MGADQDHKDAGWRLRWSWPALVLGLGFFALVAQTVLLRGFLAAAEGSEVAVGVFFGSWLAWVGLGAVVARAASRAGPFFVRSFPALALLYLPAFVVQHELIENARELAGVPAYEVFPLGALIGVSLATNAPVSLVTGFLFTAACIAAPRAGGLPVARVFVLEALGGFGGGVMVTLLLAAGVAGETAFLAGAAVLAAAAAPLLTDRGRSLGRRLAPAALPLALVVALGAGLGASWADRAGRAAWSRLLPAEAYRGLFNTAQSRCVYGEREGQFLVAASGGVTDVLPDTESASEIVAVHLAQRPEARRVLLVGPGGLAAGLRLAAFPQLERIVWAHPDPEYARALWTVLPPGLRDAAARVEILDCDVRTWVAGTVDRFDLVLLGLPDVTTLAMNRLATAEFFAQVKGVLAPAGILSVRISGGANVLGGELGYLGSSMLVTLEAVFARVVLKPGDESWLLASDDDRLTGAPAVLRDRFARVPGAAAVFPPEGLLALYLPDRSQLQMGEYRKRIDEAGRDLLLNSERRPKALLFGLAVALRRGGGAIARHLPVLLSALSWIVAAGIVIYALLRLVYLAAARRSGEAGDGFRAFRQFDGSFLVFSTGLAGMGLSIVLLFLYQERFGTLYLHVGLLSALFMLGLFLGGRGAAWLLRRTGGEPPFLLATCVGVHLAVVLFVSELPEATSPALFATLFVLAGAVSGAYFPIGAQRLGDSGLGVAAAGAALELVDHLGGAAGAIGCGLGLLPVCGAAGTLALLAGLVAVNLVPELVPRRALRVPSGDRIDRIVRPAGYWLLGGAAFALVAAKIVETASAGQEGPLLEAAARELAGDGPIEPRSARLRDGATLPYFVLQRPAGETRGYVFGTGRLAGDVAGFGGPIGLAVHVDSEGMLQGLRVLRSQETPAYLEKTAAWRAALTGRKLFSPRPFEGVDAVSGATITANAITRSLEQAGRRFAVEVLGREIAEAPRAPESRWTPDVRFVALLAMATGAVALRYRPGRLGRRLFLVTALAAAGLWLNAQYSAQQVFSLLTLNLPPAGLTGAFFTVVLVPVLVALVGNVYCGWMCPFGALQELLGDLRPMRWPTDPRRSVWRFGRAVKYVLLAVLAGAFAVSRDAALLEGDPLVTFWSGLTPGLPARWALGLGAAALVVSFAFRRFWCRALCPAGAFLALVGGLSLLRRLLPAVDVKRCDLGVRTPADLDCLRCDRCRHETS